MACEGHFINAATELPVKQTHSHTSSNTAVRLARKVPFTYQFKKFNKALSVCWFKCYQFPKWIQELSVDLEGVIRSGRQDCPKPEERLLAGSNPRSSRLCYRPRSQLQFIHVISISVNIQYKQLYRRIALFSTTADKLFSLRHLCLSKQKRHI